MSAEGSLIVQNMAHAILMNLRKRIFSIFNDMRKKRKLIIAKLIYWLSFIGIFLFCELFGSPVCAHAFGQRYDLPLPLSFFMSGGALAVLLSFIIMAITAKPTHKSRTFSRVNLLNNPIGKALSHFIFIVFIRLLFVGFFLLILATGFWGEQDPSKNFSIVMIWIIAWVGLAFVCGLFGNFWALINPWNTLFSYVEIGYKKIFGKRFSKPKSYPIALGYWPSCFFFFCFAWLEIGWPGASIPSSAATALSIYTGITFFGMFVFGRKTWLKYGECFSLVFNLFARFAITEGNLESEEPEWLLRPPGVGLHQRNKSLPKLTLIIFILLLLSTVTYDGFKETATFEIVVAHLSAYIQSLGIFVDEGFIPLFVDAIGLLCFPLIFIIVYFFFIWLSAFMDEETHKTLELAGTFIFSIVPIAIAYHLSHYISLIAIEGQSVIRLISDPFGFGWNLFNTSDYKTDISIVNAKFVWYFSVILIVIGHIVSVYIAHLEATRLYSSNPEGKQGLIISQIPMIFLMTGYTMLSLWIIAQPIVG